MTKFSKRYDFEKTIIDKLEEEEYIKDRHEDDGYLSVYTDLDVYFKNTRKETILDTENIYTTAFKIEEKDGEKIIDSHKIDDLGVYITLTYDI